MVVNANERLARALYKNNEYLFLMKRPALDIETEKLIPRQLRIFQFMTIVIIAHRLNTVASCDRIIRIEKDVLQSKALMIY